MKTKNDLSIHLKRWANDQNKEMVDNNHFKNIDDNLYIRLDNPLTKCFSEGSGSELISHKGSPAKMSALDSSSALCVNVFKPLEEKHLEDIIKALKVNCENPKLEFESKHKNGAGTANIDIALLGINKSVYLESKFTEPYYQQEDKNFLKQRYLSKDNRTIKKDYAVVLGNLFDFINKEWKSEKYQTKKSNCIGLRWSNDDSKIDIAQLIKHLFGLMKTYNNDKSKFSLGYIYYNIGDDSQRSELDSFRKLLEKDEIHFFYISYQDLICNLKKELSNGEYFSYLKRRYNL